MALRRYLHKRCWRYGCFRAAPKFTSVRKEHIRVQQRATKVLLSKGATSRGSVQDQDVKCVLPCADSWRTGIHSCNFSMLAPWQCWCLVRDRTTPAEVGKLRVIRGSDLGVHRVKSLDTSMLMSHKRCATMFSGFRSPYMKPSHAEQRSP